MTEAQATEAILAAFPVSTGAWVAQSALDRGKDPLSFSGVWTATVSMVTLRPR